MLILEHSFVRILEQMSMINLMNYFLSTTAEDFVPSHAPLKNNKHFNILFSQLSRGEQKTSQNHKITPSFQVHACRTKRESWGRASILSVMPNAAPNTCQTLRNLGCPSNLPSHYQSSEIKMHPLFSWGYTCICRKCNICNKTLLSIL